VAPSEGQCRAVGAAARIGVGAAKQPVPASAPGGRRDAGSAASARERAASQHEHQHQPTGHVRGEAHGTSFQLCPHDVMEDARLHRGTAVAARNRA